MLPSCKGCISLIRIRLRSKIILIISWSNASDFIKGPDVADWDCQINGSGYLLYKKKKKPEVVIYN